MSEVRYVQHISGQGEKWPLEHDAAHSDYWSAYEPIGCGVRRVYALPKSEYRLCDPPEQQMDEMKQCQPTIVFIPPRSVLAAFENEVFRNGYRKAWAFIIEKRQP